MPTTARILTRPYRSTCRVNTRGRRVDRKTLLAWACIIVGGWTLSELLIIAIDAASKMLARG
jgi:hypothetical protein